ncbi:putative glycosyltransferase [Acorus calamus]|uniref:Glycosyltransferase n=1 Tax=Acorus calamus TaxID=4465 RepID=A0AAV9EF20_ACOCL|nr:putative glycosyltransferase [Acorus calamus]
MAVQLIILFLHLSLLPISAITTPYLSPSTFHPNYHQMLQTLKIYAYNPPQNPNFSTTSAAAAAFHAALLRSPFITTDPNLAHLFYLPLLPSPSPRSVSRYIRTVRSDLPFWNRTLGADHFILTCDGLGFESDRNLVELKKNSVHVTCSSPLPVDGRFVPHKDLALPAFASPDLPLLNRTVERFLAYHGYGGFNDPEILTVLNKLRRDPEFLIESEPSHPFDRARRLSESRFCLFFYGAGRDLTVGDALRFGCVPVLISSRPIVDLPFYDVIRWSEIAVFVRLGEDVKRAIEEACVGGGHVRMREAGVTASVHFRWNEPPEHFDAFNMVMYQLWLRRHTIRYARRNSS